MIDADLIAGKIRKRWRCKLGFHKFYFLYAHTGDAKHLYREEVLCVWCRKDASGRARRRAEAREAKRIEGREPRARETAR